MMPEERDKWDAVPIPAPGEALQRWREETWPATLRQARIDGEGRPPGSRWTTCRRCVRDPYDPSCVPCTLVLDEDGLVRPDGWAEGKPGSEGYGEDRAHWSTEDRERAVLQARKHVAKGWHKSILGDRYTRPRALGRRK